MSLYSFDIKIIYQIPPPLLQEPKHVERWVDGGVGFNVPLENYIILTLSVWTVPV